MTHMTHLQKKAAHGDMKKTLGVAKYGGLLINSFSAVDMIAVVICVRLKFSQQVSS